MVSTSENMMMYYTDDIKRNTNGIGQVKQESYYGQKGLVCDTSIPMAPPNSGPRTRDIMKYEPPPSIRPLVVIALKLAGSGAVRGHYSSYLRMVSSAQASPRASTPSEPQRPDWPTTHGKRRNSTIPRILREHGINTPTQGVSRDDLQMYHMVKLTIESAKVITLLFAFRLTGRLADTAIEGSLREQGVCFHREWPRRLPQPQLV